MSTRRALRSRNRSAPSRPRQGAAWSGSPSGWRRGPGNGRRGPRSRGGGSPSCPCRSMPAGGGQARGARPAAGGFAHPQPRRWETGSLARRGAEGGSGLAARRELAEHRGRDAPRQRDACDGGGAPRPPPGRGSRPGRGRHPGASIPAGPLGRPDGPGGAQAGLRVDGVTVRAARGGHAPGRGAGARVRGAPAPGPARVEPRDGSGHRARLRHLRRLSALQPVRHRLRAADLRPARDGDASHGRGPPGRERPRRRMGARRVSRVADMGGCRRAGESSP